MKKMYLKVLLLVAITLVSCVKEDTLIETESHDIQFPKDPLTIQEINNRISETIRTTGDFDWSKEDSHFLWSAVVHGQNVLTIGYGNEGQSFSETRDSELDAKKNSIINLVVDKEEIDKSELKIVEQDILTVIDVGIENIETIIALRKRADVRYLEPNGYNLFTYNEAQERSSS
jgi:hypothetical protein